MEYEGLPSAGSLLGADADSLRPLALLPSADISHLIPSVWEPIQDPPHGKQPLLTLQMAWRAPVFVIACFAMVISPLSRRPHIHG